jgi:hypothetical protein
MDTPGDDELVPALRDFVERTGAWETASGQHAAPVEVAVRAGGRTETFVLAPGVAGALASALRAYHDPRDHGRCEHCGGVRLDDNLICVDCGHAHGIFGQLLMERAARYEGDPEALEG